MLPSGGNEPDLGLGSRSSVCWLRLWGAIVTTVTLNMTGVLPPAENLMDKPLLEERITAGWFSVVAAAAAGIAAGVTTDKERQDTLVGVIAALALVPAAAAGE
ncbi:MAG: DUF389 domain-containing protein [Halobacteriota archaeon]